MNTENTDPPTVGPAAKWREVMEKAAQTEQRDKGKTICPNCGQWQHPKTSGFYDCFNGCAARGFVQQRMSRALVADKLYQNTEQRDTPQSRVVCRICGSDAQREPNGGWTCDHQQRDTQAHSPLPWSHGYENEGFIYDNKKTKIAEVGGDTFDELNANQQYIVKACNAYPHAEALAEALEKVLPLVESLVLDGEPYFEEQEQARATLAQWKGAQQ